MLNKPIKACILGATFNTPNMGVSVLAAGALRCILHSFPQAHVSQLDYGREAYEFQFPYDGKGIRVRFVNIRFSKKIYLLNNIALLVFLAIASKVIPLRKARHRLLSFNRSLRELLDTDLFVSVAGGDSFSDIYGLGRLLYISLPQLLVLLTGRRLVLLPQTIGPFRHGISRVIARYILNNAERVYARDRLSEGVAQSLVGLSDEDGKFRFCYDLGFDVEAVKPSRLHIEGLPLKESDDSALIGFNVSGLLLMGGYSRDNMFGLKVPYDKLVRRLIEFLIEERFATVLLVPHVFGPASNSESDSSACETVFQSLKSRYEGKIGLVRGEYDYAEIKHIIGRCDFFVGSRMHACIGALSQSIPAVSIAYSDKFIGVMQTIGVQDLVVDPRRMDETEIVDTVDWVFARRSVVRRQLEERMPLVKQVIHDALRDISGLSDREQPFPETGKGAHL
jgi:polysaccharide pyruvyl transferase WcaK-like protein